MEEPTTPPVQEEEKKAPAPVDTPTPTAGTFTQADLDAARKEGYGRGFGEALSTADRHMKDAGFEKPDGIKTIDFLKTVVTEKPKTAPAEPNEEIKTLQGKLEQLQTMYDGSLQELESSKGAMLKTMFTAKVDSEIAPLLASAPDDMKATLREMILLKLDQTKTETTQDGKIVFVGDQGQYIASSDAKGYKSISDFVSESFGSFLKAPETASKKPTQAEAAKMTLEEKQRVGKTMNAGNLSAYMQEWSAKTGNNLGSPAYAEERAKKKKEFE